MKSNDMSMSIDQTSAYDRSAFYPKLNPTYRVSAR